jgi:TolB-like protein/DNA-binding winged helix-turn-helix (wHTH) protein/Tfp pilus assembly protein PilF
MAPQAGTTNTRDLTPDPAAYQVDDLIIDLAPRRVRRAGTVIPLKALSFDLLVALVRAAPSLVSFDQLSERVWPGLVITPETIVQRVKLLRSALGDDPHAPRYIEGVRGRGYRMVAEVRPLTERHGTPEFIVPPSLKETKEEESPNMHADIAATGAAAVSSPSGTSSAAPRPAIWGPLGWIGGALIIVGLLAASWAIVHYRGLSKPAERTSVVVSPVIHSLVVLPLENLSGDKEQEYFADGMTDALTTNLAQIGSLRVISRTSAMQYRGTRKPLSDIAGELKVDAVVEGTVLRSGNRVRITAQLIEAIGDRHLWAQSYERDLNDILGLQDDVSRDIADVIRIKLTPQQRAMLTAARAVDPEAYDAYLRGRYWWSENAVEPFASGQDLRKGLDYFQKAIAKDPNYALAYTGIADSFLLLGGGPGFPWKEAVSKAKDAAIKALQFDKSLAEAHASLASIMYGEWDWSGAEREFKEALALNPNYAHAHIVYSLYLTTVGRLDEGVQEARHARDLDPFSFRTNFLLGMTLYEARRYDDALRQFHRGLEMYPDNGAWNWGMGLVYEQRKMFAEAYAEFHQSISLNKETQRVEAIEQAFKHSGYRGAVRQMIQFLEENQKSSEFTYVFIAHHYAMLDDEARAMLCLERAYDERNPGLSEMLLDPALDHLRGSPRFRDLVRRMGLPPSVISVPIGALPDHQSVGAR